jgi:hypothetical protein
VCEHPPVLLADELRALSPELAARFDGIPLPVALYPTSARPPSDAATGTRFPTLRPEDIADPTARVAMLVGPLATLDIPRVHRLALDLGAPVANTWGAKGIYPWDDPHHMGTCGLQRDDFALLGLGDFDVVVTVGLDAAEVHPDVPHGTRLLTAPDPFDVPVPGAPRRLTPAGDNELYRRMSAIAQPGYVDPSYPRHPARAVMDLKQSLGPTTRVTAQPGDAGLWVARTFPTDRPGRVVVPAYDRPGIGVACGLVSAGRGTDTVTVVRGPTADDATAAVLDVARRHDLPLRFERWGDDVDWSRTDELIAAAGSVVAWTA